MRPLLAATIKDVTTLTYPLIASPKIDGIRCLIVGKDALSRSLKPIPNRYIQTTLQNLKLPELDGELIVGSPIASDCFRKTTSAVMSHNGCPEFTYYIFDTFVVPEQPFEVRLCKLPVFTSRYVKVLRHTLIQSSFELLVYEKDCIKIGYEGVMTRSPSGPYKFGRSTLREETLLKLKRFSDGEAIIVDKEELLHNANEAKTNALGYTERSTHNEGKISTGLLGSLVVEDTKTHIRFKIGTGFTEVERTILWNQPDLLGRVVKYKSFKIGVKVAPRFPVFLGFRDKRDL